MKLTNLPDAFEDDSANETYSASITSQIRR